MPLYNSLASHEPRSSVAVLEPYERNARDRDTAIAQWEQGITFLLTSRVLVDIKDSNVLLHLGYTRIKFITSGGVTLGMHELRPLILQVHAGS